MIQTMRVLRRAVRSLFRRPTYGVLVVSTLALGIGASTAMFTMVDQVVLRPLPVGDQDRLIVAWGHHRTRDLTRFPFTYAAYERVREDAQGLEGVAAHDAWGTAQWVIEDEDGLTPVRWTRVAGDFFGVLGVDALAGRTLEPEDDRPGAARAVMVSHWLSLRRWGGAASALGNTLRVNGELYTVVGVLPAEFDYPEGAEVWSALRSHYPDWASERPWTELELAARLAPGTTPEAAAREIDRTLRNDSELSGTYGDVDAVVQRFPERTLGDLRPTLYILLAGALLLLAVACFNVANLLFVRTTRRETDLMVRRALGAEGWHLARDAFAEGAVLAALAGAGGAALATAAIRWILPLAPAGLPRLDEVSVEPTTLLVVAGLTLTVIVLLGLYPVRRALKLQPATRLRGTGRSRGRRRGSRSGLVVAQTALALWTVAAALLLVRTLDNLRSLELGFDTRELVLVELDHEYPMFQVPPDLPDRFRTASERLEAHPGIASATPVLTPPLVGSGGIELAPTLQDESTRAPPYVGLELVLPGYFEKFGLHVPRGRPIGPQDTRGAARAVVVNEAAARALWPGEEALGKRLKLPFRGYRDVWWNVVGVAADSRYRELLQVRPALYFPMHQLREFAPRYLAVRTAGPVDLLPVVEAAFQEVDPSVAPVGAVSVRDRLAAPLARPRFALTVLGAFAGAVLLLAGIGVLGVMAANVAWRRGEMGVRLACGASPRDVAWLVLRHGLGVAAAGAVLGAAAAVATGRALEAMLFQVEPTDTATLLVAAVMVLVVAAISCAVPALRAARTDPVEVLR